MPAETTIPMGVPMATGTRGTPNMTTRRDAALSCRCNPFIISIRRPASLPPPGILPEPLVIPYFCDGLSLLAAAWARRTFVKAFADGKVDLTTALQLQAYPILQTLAVQSGDKLPQTL